MYKSSPIQLRKPHRLLYHKPKVTMPPLNSKTFTVIISLVLSLNFIVWLASQLFPSFLSTFITLYTITLPLFGLIGLFYNFCIRITHHRWHAGTNLISIAIIIYGLGELLWYYYTHFSQVEIPYPSLADLWYSLFYPLTILGLTIIILKVENIYAPFIQVAGMIGTITYGLVYLFLIYQGPQIFTLNPESFKSFFDASYVLWDAFLLVLIIVLAGYIFSYSRQNRYPLFAVYTAGIGVTLMLLGDTFFAYSTDIGNYTEGSFIDLLFLFSLYTLTLSTISFHSDKTHSFSAGKNSSPPVSLPKSDLSHST